MMKGMVARGVEIRVEGRMGGDIQRALDEVSARGGGRVVVPAGDYETGTLELRSHVELHLEKGARLRGSLCQEDYNRNDAFAENFWSEAEEWSGGHLLLGYKVEDVAITGEGVIDGRGSEFFGECDEDSRWPWYKYGIKLHPLDRAWFRPGPMVAIFLSKNVRVEGVTMLNPPSWTCHVRCTDGFVARGVTIETDRTVANSDGFSIDCTRNVVLEKCTIRTGDDAIAIRASCRHHAAENACENIRVVECDLWSCCYGIRFGIGSGTIRNVQVERCRVHEAAESAFGFTPAWIEGERNCFIEDIAIRDCWVTDCVRPVTGFLSANSKVDGIRLEGCEFHTMLPSQLDARCGVTFERCVRETIPRVRVRSRFCWCEREIRTSWSVFLDGGAREKLEVIDCEPKPLGSAGILLLAFDDRNFADWEHALPLFEKVRAHATFFVSGELDADAVRTCKRLLAAGHTVGLHGMNHLNVPPALETWGWEEWWKKEVAIPKRQAEVAYLPVHCFAYPNNAHTEESDAALLKRFERLRAGISGVRPYDPEGTRSAGLKPLVTEERLFFPARELPQHRVLGGVILGDAYHVELEDVLACIRRIAERKEVVLFTSHGIHDGATGIHLKREWLEAILVEAERVGVQVLGFDELP